VGTADFAGTEAAVLAATAAGRGASGFFASAMSFPFQFLVSDDQDLTMFFNTSATRPDSCETSMRINATLSS
jgi:hypothetical protein